MCGHHLTQSCLTSFVMLHQTASNIFSKAHVRDQISYSARICGMQGVKWESALINHIDTPGTKHLITRSRLRIYAAFFQTARLYDICGDLFRHDAPLKNAYLEIKVGPQSNMAAMKTYIAFWANMTYHKGQMNQVMEIKWHWSLEGWGR